MSVLRARPSAALVLGAVLVAASWTVPAARTPVAVPVVGLRAPVAAVVAAGSSAVAAGAQAQAGAALAGGPVPATVRAVRSAVDPRAPIAAPVLVPVELPGATSTASPSADASRSGMPGSPSSTPDPSAPSESGTSSAPEAPSDAPGSPLDPDEVDAVLAPLLAGGALGSGPSPARVVDVATGEVLYEAADEPTVPASTMKLVTAASVLDGLGPDAVLHTSVVLTRPNAAAPRVVLVGAGDPSLTSKTQVVGGAGTSVRPASLQELTDATAKALALRGITRVRVAFDDSLFTGPALHPTWARSFPSLGIVAPVSALAVDQGRRIPNGVSRVPDPAARAGQVFAEQLAEAGLVVRGEPSRHALSGAGSTLATVESPALGVLVERMLSTSDNDYAEVLGRLAAAGAGEPASFTGVARNAPAVLASLGIDTNGARFADASGLSRTDRLPPELLTELLAKRASGFGALHSGLPVAGATGSLRARFRTGDQRAAAGIARAKTGTLTGVTGLAGYLSRPDGRLLAFAFIDDSTPGGASAARSAIDEALAALVECDCAAHPDPPADPISPLASSPSQAADQ